MDGGGGGGHKQTNKQKKKTQTTVIVHSSNFFFPFKYFLKYIHKARHIYYSEESVNIRSTCSLRVSDGSFIALIFQPEIPQSKSDLFIFLPLNHPGERRDPSSLRQQALVNQNTYPGLAEYVSVNTLAEKPLSESL